MTFAQEAITETYNDVESLIFKLCHKYSKQYGGSIDDLYSEACELFTEAYYRFDNSKGVQFSTYIYRTIWLGLRTHSKHKNEFATLEDVEAYFIESNQTSIDFAELKKTLPRDARKLLMICTETPAVLMKEIRLHGYTDRAWKKTILQFVEQLGWTSDRAYTAYLDIRKAMHDQKDAA